MSGRAESCQQVLVYSPREHSFVLFPYSSPLPKNLLHGYELCSLEWVDFLPSVYPLSCSGRLSVYTQKPNAALRHAVRLVQAPSVVDAGTKNSIVIQVSVYLLSCDGSLCSKSVIQHNMKFESGQLLCIIIIL